MSNATVKIKCKKNKKLIFTITCLMNIVINEKVANN